MGVILSTSLRCHVSAKPPTARQLAVYRFMCDTLREQGRPPALRDICRAFDFASPNSVVSHLKALVRKGLVRRAGKATSTRVYVPAVPTADVKIVGGEVRLAATGAVTFTVDEWRTWLTARLAEVREYGR